MSLNKPVCIMIPTVYRKITFANHETLFVLHRPPLHGRMKNLFCVVLAIKNPKNIQNVPLIESMAFESLRLLTVKFF